MVFVVPDPRDLYESEVATWIEHDVQAEESRRIEQLEAQLERATSGGVSTQDLAVEIAQLRAKRAAAAAKAAQETVMGEVVPPAPSARPQSATEPAPATEDDTGETPSPAAGQARPAMPLDEPTDEGPDYPQALFVTESAPHLVVRACTQDGVEMAFDSSFLDCDGFRMSMPVRCVYTGEADTSKLIARPLAFIDRSQAVFRSARDLERSREQRLRKHDAASSLLSRLRRIDGLPLPFSKPLPYYVAGESDKPALVCTTHQREDAGFTCVVLIPDGRYALDWLANVNGICGNEYAMLQRDIGELWTDAWSQLAEQCRQRIAVWCHFEAGEHFRTYLTDADFNRRDEGLAGMVVTDRRLVYCKYHHRGEVRFTDGVTLLVREDVLVSRVYAVTPTGRTRLVKLHLADTPRFLDAVDQVRGVKLKVEAAKKE